MRRPCMRWSGDVVTAAAAAVMDGGVSVWLACQCGWLVSVACQWLLEVTAPSSIGADNSTATDKAH